MGLGSFGTLAFWGPKACLMYGTTHIKDSPAGRRTITKFTARTRSCRRKPPPGREPRMALQQREISRIAGYGHAPLADVDLCSCQRSEARQTARVETSRGREKSAQEYIGAMRECRRERDIRVKREPLSVLYRKEKRALGVWWVFS